jgi:hypothetical protein
LGFEHVYVNDFYFFIFFTWIVQKPKEANVFEHVHVTQEFRIQKMMIQENVYVNVTYELRIEKQIAEKQSCECYIKHLIIM